MSEPPNTSASVAPSSSSTHDPSPCRIDPLSSRACERGRRSCIETHAAVACIGDGRNPCDENEWTLNENRRCRDCDIAYTLDQMECKTCGRMQYRADDERLGGFGAYLWGERCTCADLPKG